MFCIVVHHILLLEIIEECTFEMLHLWNRDRLFEPPHRELYNLPRFLTFPVHGHLDNNTLLVQTPHTLSDWRISVGFRLL